MTAAERSPCGTVCVVGSIFSSRPAGLKVLNNSLARREAIKPMQR